MNPLESNLQHITTHDSGLMVTWWLMVANLKHAMKQLVQFDDGWSMGHCIKTSNKQERKT